MAEVSVAISPRSPIRVEGISEEDYYPWPEEKEPTSTTYIA